VTASGVPQCGTPGAYYRHKQAGERCDVCWAAQAARDRARIRDNPRLRERRVAAQQAKRRRLRAVAEPDAVPEAPVFLGDLPCRSGDPDLWFSDAQADIARAKKACYACPVLGACRAWALDHPGEWGIWGGLDRRQRRRILKEAA